MSEIQQHVREDENGIVRRKKRIRYSDALGRRIMDLIEDKMTIKKISEMEGMPSPKSIHRWRHQKPDFHQKMCKSERIRKVNFEDEMIDLTNEDVGEYLINKLGRSPDKNEIVLEMYQRRQRIDTLKFIVSKMYGTKPDEQSSHSYDRVINIVNYESQKTEEQKQLKVIPDLQPAHLKVNSNLTPAQQAQQAQLMPSRT